MLKPELASLGALVRADWPVRVSPLLHAHVRVLGRYQFTLDGSVAEGGTRPLRDPDEFGPHLSI